MREDKSQAPAREVAVRRRATAGDSPAGRADIIADF